MYIVCSSFYLLFFDMEVCHLDVEEDFKSDILKLIIEKGMQLKIVYITHLDQVMHIYLWRWCTPPVKKNAQRSR